MTKQSEVERYKKNLRFNCSSHLTVQEHVTSTVHWKHQITTSDMSCWFDNESAHDMLSFSTSLQGPHIVVLMHIAPMGHIDRYATLATYFHMKVEKRMQDMAWMHKWFQQTDMWHTYAFINLFFCQQLHKVTQVKQNSSTWIATSLEAYAALGRPVKAATQHHVIACDNMAAQRQASFDWVNLCLYHSVLGQLGLAHFMHYFCLHVLHLPCLRDITMGQRRFIARIHVIWFQIYGFPIARRGRACSAFWAVLVWFRRDVNDCPVAPASEHTPTIFSFDLKLCY